METNDGRAGGMTRRLAAPTAVAVALVLAIAGSLKLMGGDDGSLAIVAEPPVANTTTTTSVDDEAPAQAVASPVFVDPTASTTPPVSRATTTTKPSTTVKRTTTTSTTTSTVPVVTVTLPEQPAQPITPPADPRGAEEQIRLGAIRIPKLGVDAPLLEGIRLTTLDNGPGHWPGTAMPGQVGNVVVAAHRTSHGAPFRHIDQLVAGDIVQFETADGLIDYSVTKTFVVNPQDVWIVDPTDTPTATLFACHPPGSVRQRIVVSLELVV